MSDSVAWDKLPDEPDKWFSRFERFRMMGPRRTLLGCVNAERAEDGRKRRRMDRVPGSWDQASKKWRWRERVAAWDAEQSKLAREAELEELANRRKAWIAQAQSLQAVGGMALIRLQEKLQEMDADSPLSPKDVLAFLSEGLKLELLSRGQATEVQKHEISGTINWDALCQRRQDAPDPIEEAIRKAGEKDESQDSESSTG